MFKSRGFLLNIIKKKTDKLENYNKAGNISDELIEVVLSNITKIIR
jgi:hypothetical protein